MPLSKSELYAIFSVLSVYHYYYYHCNIDI